MPSDLWVTSKSNKHIVEGYFNVKDYLLIDKPPSCRPKIHRGRVYAVGGGSVIDYAKMIAGRNQCRACPTTASGAVSTSHAVIWTDKAKINVKTARPILMMDFVNICDNYINLPHKTLRRTIFDCLFHILESRHSSKANFHSTLCGNLAEKELLKFFARGEYINLIKAGNLAGDAIEITGTNIFHARSYVYTLKDGICHGDALMQALEFNPAIEKQAQKYKKYYESTLL